MKARNFPKPVLEALQSATPTSRSSAQSAGGERLLLEPMDVASSAQKVPPGVGASSSTLPPRADSTSEKPGKPLPTQLSQVGRTPMQSYVVSDSGGTLTLGTHYHVSSSGVHEFRPPVAGGTTVVRGDAGAYQLELPACSSSAPLRCDHISQLDFDNGLQIGRGSSGKVYNVLHIPSGLRVCVKQMLIDDARHREEIKRELDSLHKSSSRFIVDFYGAFFHNDLGVILLVLELMEGSLLEVLRVKKRLTERQTKGFALQVVHGLRFLHSERHLIHRDIKPANLLFHRSGQVKITDFGVSTGQRSQDPNSAITFVGSILYMSPERLEAKSYGYDCDIWSLGITLCEIVTGHHPYQEDFSSSTATSLTFWGLLQKVMQADPDLHRAPIAMLLKRLPPSENPPVVSASMDHFVASCLAFDKTHRASAEELLRHPWLSDITLEESESIVREVATEVAAVRGGGAEPAILAPSMLEAMGTTPVSSSVALFSHSQKSKPTDSAPKTPTPRTSAPRPDRTDLTPASLTPEEKRMKSHSLLEELVSSVKK